MKISHLLGWMREGRRCKSALSLIIQREQSRRDYRRDAVGCRERCTGNSSDALVMSVLTGETVPRSDYPLDLGDLAACYRTYAMAPRWMQRKMIQTLIQYREFVATRYDVTTIDHALNDTSVPWAKTNA